MKRIISFLACVALVCGLSSCAANNYYKVKVNGYTDPSAPGLIKPGGSFYVMTNREAKNPLLEAEIKEKINKLLAIQGYPATTLERADYVLFFGYGLGEPRGVTTVTPDYYGGFGWGMGYGWGGPAFALGFPVWGGYSAESATLYDRWLLINVVDGPAYRTGKQSQPVWAGEARSVGASSDLRTVLNYLLVADFQQFGKNTGQALTVELGEKDPAVFSLTH